MWESHLYSHIYVCGVTHINEPSKCPFRVQTQESGTLLFVGMLVAFPDYTEAIKLTVACFASQLMAHATAGL